MARKYRPPPSGPRRTLGQKIVRLGKLLVLAYLAIVGWANWQEWNGQESGSPWFAASRRHVPRTWSDAEVEAAAPNLTTPDSSPISVDDPATTPGLAVTDPDMSSANPRPYSPAETPITVPVATPDPLDSLPTPGSTPVTPDPFLAVSPPVRKNSTTRKVRVIMPASPTPSAAPSIGEPYAVPSPTPAPVTRFEFQTEPTATVTLPASMNSISLRQTPNGTATIYRLLDGEKVQPLPEISDDGWQHINIHRDGKWYSGWVERRYLLSPALTPEDFNQRRASR